MASSKMTQCKSCGAEIAKSAKACPHCGAKNKKPVYKKWWFWVIIAFIVIGAATGGNDSKTTTNNSTTITETKPVETTKTAETTKPAETEKPTEAATEPTESMTTGQANALKAAKNYLSFSAFSHDGLIQQLEFEKYTTEQATYGADNCGADWFEQAAKSAKNYLSFSSFSKDGLIQQLEFEKFTHEQAVYGAEQNGY